MGRGQSGGFGSSLSLYLLCPSYSVLRPPSSKPGKCLGISLTFAGGLQRSENCMPEKVHPQSLSQTRKSISFDLFDSVNLQPPTAFHSTNSSSTSAGAHLFNLERQKSSVDFYSVTMAPKKSKTADTINSRLALVMKSGKGTPFLEICIFPKCIIN